MIKPTLLTFAFCLIFSSAYAQVGTHYSYDNAGNRIGYYQVKSLSQDEPDKPTEEEIAETGAESNSKSLVDSEPRVSVFPNPTSGLVTIRWDDSDFAPYDLRVVSEDGRTILQSRITSPVHEFDIMKQSPGSYVVFVQSSTKELTWQIVKK